MVGWFILRLFCICSLGFFFSLFSLLGYYDQWFDTIMVHGYYYDSWMMGCQTFPPLSSPLLSPTLLGLWGDNHSWWLPPKPLYGHKNSVGVSMNAFGYVSTYIQNRIGLQKKGVNHQVLLHLRKHFDKKCSVMHCWVFFFGTGWGRPHAMVFIFFCPTEDKPPTHNSFFWILKQNECIWTSHWHTKRLCLDTKKCLKWQRYFICGKMHPIVSNSVKRRCTLWRQERDVLWDPKFWCRWKKKTITVILSPQSYFVWQMEWSRHILQFFKSLQFLFQRHVFLICSIKASFIPGACSVFVSPPFRILLCNKRIATMTLHCLDPFMIVNGKKFDKYICFLQWCHQPKTQHKFITQ